MDEQNMCPMCGGWADGIDQHSDLEAESAPEAHYVGSTELGNEDQEEARKGRLAGVLDGIRKRHMGK